MINIDKISQLKANITLNSRMPSNPIIHQLAYGDHAIGLLNSGFHIHYHIVFLAIRPEQSFFIQQSIFRSVHCIIVKEYGVILSSNCSLVTEGILEHFAKWAPYLKVQEDVQFYSNKFKKNDYKKCPCIYTIH